MNKNGKITQIIGAVVDVNFENELPEIYPINIHQFHLGIIFIMMKKLILGLRNNLLTRLFKSNNDDIVFWQM